MYLYPEDFYKLILALALGGAIGAERELRDKAAGLRTLMFISAGSAMFTIFSSRLVEGTNADPTRLTAQIISGIGFLGAGVILREHGEIRGLTTAATIWLVAALGVGVGGGQFSFSILTTAILLLALWIFPHVERFMSVYRQVRTYTITVTGGQAKYESLLNLCRQMAMDPLATRLAWKDQKITATITVSGKRQGHEALVKRLFEDPEVEAFEV